MPPKARQKAEELVRAHQPELLNLPQEQRQKVIELVGKMGAQSVTVARAEMQMHSGPLPSASELARYNDLIPNGAERIMVMAEKQLDHRVQIETTVINSEQKQATRGQIFGFLLVGALIVAGTVLGLHGQSIPAAAVFTTTILSVAGAFVLGRKAQERNLDEKRS